jgi:alanine racemase
MRDATRCWAEIDLDALRNNAGVARRCIGPSARLMAVVKANAYGHGAVEVARALRGHAQMFGVANLREAREIRAADSATDIMILGTALPAERAEIVREGFLPVVSSLDEARAYGEIGPVRAHVALDTGMGRIGVWEDDAPAALREMRGLPGFVIDGVATHLPSADEDEAFTAAQLARFEKIVAQIEPRPPLVHSLNSAGILRFSTHACGMVRAGLMLYGSSPLAEFQVGLRAVMTWKTRVTLLRDVGEGRGVSYGGTFVTPRAMRIATLAVGYADGYPRALSGSGAEVLVHGRRCAVLGRVTMDQIMVDVTEIADAQIGDEAVLIGRQGGEEITAAELAAKAGTIAWEIFTGVKTRVERFYSGHVSSDLQ